MSQPVEGQERANPILTTEFEILTDSARARQMARWCRRPQDIDHAEAEKTVISYICDRERAIVWGIEGGCRHAAWPQHQARGSGRG